MAWMKHQRNKMTMSSRDRDVDRKDRSRVRGHRITINNITTKGLQKQELKEYFGKHGHIMDIYIDFNRDSVTLTYEQEEDAKTAVDKEHMNIFKACKMDVRMLLERRESKDRRRSPDPPSRRHLPYERDSRQMSPYSRSRSERERGGSRDRGRDRSPMDRRGGGRDGDFRDNDRRRGDEDGGRRMGRDERYPEPPPMKRPPPMHDVPPSLPTAKSPYDTAVIAMDQGLVPFAEVIERRLQRATPLVTHIIVLKEEAHVAPCVEELTTKGVLYAIIVNRMNEQHGSCTLRLLYGSPQEHRNMPLEDAMGLVTRNFDGYLQASRDKKMTEPAKDHSRAPPGFVPPSERVIYLLHLLADFRMLTVNELEEVIDFVQDRHAKLVEVEGGKLPAKKGYGAPESPKPQQRQADLQAKILSMLNPGAAPPEPKVTSDQTEIQKALDTLLQSQARPPAEEHRPYPAIQPANRYGAPAPPAQPPYGAPRPPPPQQAFPRAPAPAPSANYYGNEYAEAEHLGYDHPHAPSGPGYEKHLPGPGYEKQHPGPGYEKQHPGPGYEKQPPGPGYGPPSRGPAPGGYGRPPRPPPPGGYDQGYGEDYHQPQGYGPPAGYRPPRPPGPPRPRFQGYN